MNASILQMKEDISVCGLIFKMNIPFCMIEEKWINQEIVIDCDRILSPEPLSDRKSE